MVNARDIDIKVEVNERRDPITGALISTLDEIERSQQSNLITRCWAIGPNTINPLAVLASDEIFVVTFAHFEPFSMNGPGQISLVEHGDGMGAGHVVFRSGVHEAVPPFKRTLGVGRPIIIALGPGNVEANETSGMGFVAGTLTWYVKKTTPTQYVNP